MREIIFAALFLTFFGALVIADDAPPATPTSPQAVEAKKKHDSSIKDAREKLHKAIIAADQQYIAELDAALKAAMQREDIDAARALDDQKKAAEAMWKRDQAESNAANGRGHVAIVGATVKPGATNLSLPHDAQVYIYGMTTGGLESARFKNGSVAVVNNHDGFLSAQLAVTNQPENQFSTSCAYYAIGGFGVSGYGSLTALYGTNEGPAASSASVSFTLDGPATVVLFGLGSSQQSIGFDGLSNIQMDVPAEAAQGTVAIAIGHAELGPGKYTVRGLTKTTADAQDPNHQADLLGVLIFSSDAGIVSSKNPKLDIPQDIAAP